MMARWGLEPGHGKIFMSGKTFLDSNILIYAYDNGDDVLKQNRAQKILNEGIASDDIVLSAQVLSEFYTTVTKRFENPLSSVEALNVIELVNVLQIISIDVSLVKRAIETQERYQINYWDGLIITAAERARCSTIFSEDLNAGQLYHDIEVENPFTDL